MKPTKPMTAVAALGLALGMMATGTAQADSFGTPGNEFTIDFVDVGNAGNLDDDTGYGGVSYEYRMGTYEISQDAITKATASGMTNVTAGAWTGNQPAAHMTWYEAAAFVNWLNTSTGRQAAYNLTYSGGWSMTLWSSGDAWQLGGENLYRHKDAYYFISSEDEWYKAAYYDPNKSGGAGYWNFATGSDMAPTPVASGTSPGTAVYSYQSGPVDVSQTGGLSPYGTRGQIGNVWEWSESAQTPPNDYRDEMRVIRGGDWYNPDFIVNTRGAFNPTESRNDQGFRVASVPEPSAALLVLMAGGAWLLRKRGKSSL